MGKFVSANSVLLVAAMAVMFMGCGEATTSEGTGADVPVIVKTFEDLPNCAKGKYAQVYYVTEGEEQGFYYCGQSTENPNQYGYTKIEVDAEYCTVVDLEGFSELIECPDGTSVVVHDIACIHDETICDDTNECTDTSCDPRFGCLSTPTHCDDGNACTADSCDPATGCINEPISCDDGTVCTIDSCDPATGCINEPISCDDGQLCTIDTCDPVTGCSNEPNPCDDGRLCTDDSCDPYAGCQHEYRLCDLYYEACSEESGLCEPRSYAFCPCFNYSNLTATYFDMCDEYIASNPNAPGKGLDYSGYPYYRARVVTWDETNRHCDAKLRASGSYIYYTSQSQLREEDWNQCMTWVDLYTESYGITCNPVTDP